MSTTTRGSGTLPGKRKVKVPAMTVPEVCKELMALQRQRNAATRMRIMQENRLLATVASALGYSARQDETKREEGMKAARALIGEVVEHFKRRENHPGALGMTGLIVAASDGIERMDEVVGDLKAVMGGLAKQLPVKNWVLEPEQNGFGLDSLAGVVGEAGDLSLYATPPKLWRRLGCAPYTKGGVTLMGSTWRFKQEGSLTAEEWADYGYNPRRRSFSYVIGENLIKQMGTPYRARYVEAKVKAFKSHPEWPWKDCEKCEGKGKRKAEGTRKVTTCGTCGGTGQKCQRAHLHGMLLATKLLYKRLWRKWHRVPVDVDPPVGSY